MQGYGAQGPHILLLHPADTAAFAEQQLAQAVVPLPAPAAAGPSGYSLPAAPAMHLACLGAAGAAPALLPDGAVKKGRLRWTPQLHSLFVAAVEQLGGAFTATPKRILETMQQPGMTLYHIKSHLQKYRNAVTAHAGRGCHRRRRSRAACAAPAEAAPVTAAAAAVVSAAPAVVGTTAAAAVGTAYSAGLGGSAPGGSGGSLRDEVALEALLLRMQGNEEGWRMEEGSGGSCDASCASLLGGPEAEQEEMCRDVSFGDLPLGEGLSESCRGGENPFELPSMDSLLWIDGAQLEAAAPLLPEPEGGAAPSVAGGAAPGSADAACDGAGGLKGAAPRGAPYAPGAAGARQEGQPLPAPMPLQPSQQKCQQQQCQQQQQQCSPSALGLLPPLPYPQQPKALPLAPPVPPMPQQQSQLAGTPRASLQEALRLQLEMQRQLSATIEAQRQLQVQLEAQNAHIQKLLRLKAVLPSQLAVEPAGV